MKIFGEEHFIDPEMVNIVSYANNAISQKIDEIVFDEMETTIRYRLPEIKIDKDRLKRWVVLCMKLENIEHSDLIDMATKKKMSEIRADERRKVCEETRDIFLKSLGLPDEEWVWNSDCYAGMSLIKEILDKIEKGESE